MDRFNLGKHTMAITSSSSDAQHWFNLGLNWCYGFNHEEGVKCFQEALKHDANCVMAHWGVAYAAGPFYNYPWGDFCPEEAAECTLFCHKHITMAQQHSAKASELEHLLVNALAMRFQKPYPVPLTEFNRWDEDYAGAMRRVYYRFNNNHDVMALCAEALMTRTPWKLWNVKTGQPAAHADTIEALEIIERSIALNETAEAPPHPAILHLHIHATEMSQEPERAMKSADLLGALCPDAGHMNHMPGHTYVLCGEYEKAKLASVNAIRADNLYVDYAGPYNFYTTARAHDLHLMMYTCMFLGQYAPAMLAAEQLCSTLSKDVLSVKGRTQMATTMEGYYSMKMHVLIRFGRWQDIIDTPMPECPVLYCVSTTMHHYAKGIAYATLKQFEAADQQCQLFHEALARVPSERKFFNNQAKTILGVGEMMLAGEVAYHRGNYEAAFEYLRESVRRDDDLEYTEPWAWMHPPRHALAALLAEQGHYDEAEEVYRTDLGLNNVLQRCAQHPNNVWSLHGLVECLQQRCETQELPELQTKLKAALAQADVPITSSCLCRMHTQTPSGPTDTCCSKTTGKQRL